VICPQKRFRRCDEMKVRILGGGFYGSHIALSLINDGHYVELHEISGKLFSGASGAIPARLHCGSHYPRSKLTRDACKSHYKEFMEVYGHLTRHVPINLYCIAAYDSLLDFGTYRQILDNDIEYITVVDTDEFGLRNVEGAILTGERHILVDRAREFFSNALNGYIRYNTPTETDSNGFDLTIDCTFCARDEKNIDRFELCLTVLMSGPVDKAVTVMDGPFPSLYVWDEDNGICSLTSAKWTPLETFSTWSAAKQTQNIVSKRIVENHCSNMIEQMRFYYPEIENYKVEDCRLAIRAMPRSGCDARLVDIMQPDENTIRVRAGKIDAIFYAYETISRMISSER
jgi:hypothetical protein